MFSALDIAAWFIERNHRENIEGDSDLITNLKLQKLLYYAQGVYSAITGNFLFEENILAWEHGPVVEEVYHQYKRYKGLGIRAIQGLESHVVIDQETSNILEQVYEHFGQYSAWKLRDMTHEEVPWKSTERNQVIDRELIRDYIKNVYIEE